NPTRFLGTSLDIMDAKRAQEELPRTAQFREQFMSVLGHDLHNLPWTVQGSADLMLREEGLLPGQRTGRCASVAAPTVWAGLSPTSSIGAGTAGRRLSHRA